MKPLSILWVNPSFLDYRIPLYNELNTLCKGNFFLVYSKERIPERCVNKVEQVLGLNAIGLEKEKQIKLGHKGDFANTGISLPFPKGLYKLIKSVQADIIIAEGFFQFTPWALFRSVSAQIPLMIAYERTAHTERHCPWWRRTYRKVIGKFVSGYIANGILTKEYLVSGGVSPEKIFTGGMCADSQGLAVKCDKFSIIERIAFKKRLKIVREGLVYIYVGRLIELKGVEYLLKAWVNHIKQYPHDTLMIVGDGPLRDDFVAQYGLGYNVLFVGGVDYAEIYKYYVISNVFVIPTLEDNWSLVVPEAMACGLPIACSIYNGCYPELVQEGRNGVLFDPLEEVSISDALSVFHSIELKKYGEESKVIEQQFSPQRTALNIYEAACKIKAGNRRL